MFFGIILSAVLLSCLEKLVFSETAAEPKSKKSPQAVLKYDSKGKRDPFLPLVTPDGRILEFSTGTEGEGGLYLKGITFDAGGASYAVINDEIVKIGDRIEGCEVLDIQPKKVILTKDGEKIEIGINEED